MQRPISNPLVTPRLVMAVVAMREGGWWRVSRSLDPTTTSVGTSVASRLVELGWAERDVQRSLSTHVRPVTYVRLTGLGLAQAVLYAQHP